MVASGGGLSEGYGYDGPGVCLGDCQTEAGGVTSQGGRGDALLRRMSPYLTLNSIVTNCFRRLQGHVGGTSLLQNTIIFFLQNNSFITKHKNNFLDP